MFVVFHKMEILPSARYFGRFFNLLFSERKILFQDDLIQMRKTGDILKAAPKQLALYNAIKELKLDVTTIVQSSNLNNKDNKVVISFAELEASIKK